MTQIRAARAASDWPALAATAHRLRPTLQLLGAAGLLPALALLEAPNTHEADKAAAAEAFERGLAELLEKLPRAVSKEAAKQEAESPSR